MSSVKRNVSLYVCNNYSTPSLLNKTKYPEFHVRLSRLMPLETEIMLNGIYSDAAFVPVPVVYHCKA